ncbi:Uncharacterized protein C8035_v002429 [Colletotrichum spinosum]|uniref:T6SS Phospholipase effector Tle1-like catalytic domain-containing protein n=1 Tax=Colletotrichum spinosum TaxID=1347390 RepID=A0A4R8QAH2_9PEZI|nr:Uncharacterized protein C8035_v002429 [Colletotrichum spinosum]
MSCVLPFCEREYIAGEWKDCAHNSRDEGIHKKRLVICCDGTWNNANEGKPPTNVSRLATVVAQKCCSGMPQLVYYHRGAGTDASMGARLLGGIFGTGVVEDIRDVYRFICDNYSPDDEIVIVGFSRGAFTARSVAGMVCSIGLLNGFGLYHFHKIFEDYQNFSNWDSHPFDKEADLKAFDADSVRSLQLQGWEPGEIGMPGGLENVDWKTHREAEEAATKLRKMWFEECKSNRTVYEKDGDGTADRLEEISKWYLKKLERFKMVQCKMDHKTGWWRPRKVEIMAIGVWDTVGSLGIPKGLKLFDCKIAKQLPFESSLRNPYPDEQWTWETADESHHRAAEGWVWERWDPENKQSERLFEEHVGMWERLYMETNRIHLCKKEKDWVSTMPKHAWVRSIGKQMKKLSGRVVGGVRDSAVSTIKAPFKIAERVIYTTRATLGGVVRLLNPYSSLPKLHLFKPNSKHPKLEPRHNNYGLHDLIVWQQGDMRRYTLGPKEPSDS